MEQTTTSSTESTELVYSLSLSLSYVLVSFFLLSFSLILLSMCISLSFPLFSRPRTFLNLSGQTRESLEQISSCLRETRLKLVWRKEKDANAATRKCSVSITVSKRYKNLFHAVGLVRVRLSCISNINLLSVNYWLMMLEARKCWKFWIKKFWL